MNQIVKTIAIGAISSLVAALIGYGIKTIESNKVDEIQHLSKRTYVNKIFSGMNIKGHDLEIKLDGKSVNKLYEVSVRIFNYTSTNFEKVPLYILIQPEDQLEDTGMVVLSSEYYDRNGSQVGIKKIADSVTSEESGTIIQKFEIETVNRNDSEAVFSMRMIVHGNSEPIVKVITERAGLDIDNSQVPFYREKWYENTWFIIIIFIILFFIYVIVIIKVSKVFLTKFKSTIAQRILKYNIDELAKVVKEKGTDLSEDELSTLIREKLESNSIEE